MSLPGRVLPQHMEKVSLPGDKTAERSGRDVAVIVGLGKTGLSCARFLAHRGVPFRVVDSRLAPPELEVFRREFPEVPVHLGSLDENRLRRATQLIVSPGVSVREPALARAALAGVPITGDIEIFARTATAPVVAVTGSNGKSTVTALVGEMAAAQGIRVGVGGNIGTPALDLLVHPEPELHVLELSSFKLETTRSLNAIAAVVLNVSADHMDRYSDLADYSRAKSRIFRGGGIMVVNRDDPRVVAMVKSGRHVVGFTLGAPLASDFGLREQHGESWVLRGAEPLLPARELMIRGRHNLANAMAALALGAAAGLSVHDMLATLRRFPGLPHRCQWVARQGGVDWYNDSKGTNVGATLAAIRGLEVSAKVVLIAGGDGKGADFSPLREAMASLGRAAVLIGRDGPCVEAALDGAVPSVYAADMEEAVSVARRLARPGDAVLLSPACASFDMYADYRQRGEMFMAAVRGTEAQ